MAQMLDEGQETASDIIGFLKSNGLSDLVDQFPNECVSLQDLIDFEDVDLREYLSALHVKKSYVIRISSKIKKLKQHQNTDINPPVHRMSTKVVRIIMSLEEEQAMEQLSQRKGNISSLLKKLQIQSGHLNENAAQCKADIELQFKTLLTHINKRKDEMIQKLSDINNKKQSEIDEKIKQISGYEQDTNKAIKTCDAMIDDLNIDRYDRKKKIIAVIADVNKQQLLKELDIGTDIVFKFNHDRIESFLLRLCDVYGYIPHPLPLVSNVMVMTVSSISATVCWDAILRDNKTVETENKVFMRIECRDDMDEKEKDQLKSEFIEFNSHQRQYQYQFKHLKPNTTFVFGIKLYENNEMRNDFELVLVAVKTMKHLWKNEIVHNYKVQDLVDNGCIRVYYEPYSHVTTSDELKSLCDNNDKNTIFVGAIKKMNEDMIVLGAFGPSSVLHTMTSSTSKAFVPTDLKNTSYSVYWYHYAKNSFGFSDISDVALNTADLLDKGSNNNKLSWHLHGSGGWRVGTQYKLNSNNDWYKVVYLKTT